MAFPLAPHQSHGSQPAVLAAEVLRYAQQVASSRGAFNPRLWADLLLWPREVKRAPAAWRRYCRDWQSFHGLPTGLAAAGAAAVLHVIIGGMTDDDGDFNCFLAVATISRRAHVSPRTVQRVLAWQRDAPLPLVAISRPGQTRGMAHACHRFTLVTDPLSFVEARDAARARKVSAVIARLDEERSEDLEDQKKLLLGAITDAEYARRKAERVAAARADLPRRVKLAAPKRRVGGAARKVDQYAAQKVIQSEGGSFYVHRLRKEEESACGNVGISRSVRDFQAPVEIAL